MNPVYLFLIVPLSTFAGGIMGYLFATLLMLADAADDENE